VTVKVKVGCGSVGLDSGAGVLNMVQGGGEREGSKKRRFGVSRYSTESCCGLEVHEY